MSFKKIVLAAAVMGLAGLSAGAANAATYLWNFTDTSSHVVASGTLSTGASTTLLINGVNESVAPVIAGSGSTTGIDGFATQGLSLYGSYINPLGYFTTPDGTETYDNALIAANPALDGNGLEFTGNSTGAFINIYNNVNTGFYGPGNDPNGDIIWIGATGLTVSGTFNLSAVPEPATWAMFLLGFGAIGFAMRSARGRKTAAA